MRVYLDSSAIVKLFRVENESEALWHWLTHNVDTSMTSWLGVTESTRAGLRVGVSNDEISMVTESFVVLDVERDDFERAGTVTPVGVRSLDALHLAIAMRLGRELDAFVTYDNQQTQAARQYGFTVLAPA